MSLASHWNPSSNPILLSFLISLLAISSNNHYLPSPLSLSTMKNPFSSTTTLSSHGLLILALLLLFFFISSTATGVSTSASLETSSRNQHHRFKSQHHSCGSFPHKSSSRSWCIRFQRMNGRRHKGSPLPPPLPPPIEIDPRYGVEKRLVPSGPNPLHNWSEFLISSPYLYII